MLPTQTAIWVAAAAVLSPLLAGASAGSGTAPSIQTVYAQYVDGTEEGHFALGRSIGEAVGDDVRGAWSSDSELRQLEAWVESGEGSRIFKSLIDASNASFPLYMREVEGMAVGASVPLRRMLVNQLREELLQWLDADGLRRRPGHCTDAYVVDRQRGVTAWGHNDDWGVNWRKAAYFVVVTALDEDRAVKFKFGTWVYPGYLLGMQLNWNSYGVLWTVNSLFPKDFREGGVGTAWVARHMVASPSVPELLHRAADPRVSTAMNYNVGALGGDTLWNLEVTSGGKHALREVTGLYIHTNRFKVLDVAELPNKTVSAIHRERRWAQLRPGSITELEAFLSDHADQDWPVYRNGPTFTQVTAIFDVRRGTLSAWSAPAADGPPVLELPLTFAGLPPPPPPPGPADVLFL